MKILKRPDSNNSKQTETQVIIRKFLSYQNIKVLSELIHLKISMRFVTLN